MGAVFEIFSRQKNEISPDRAIQSQPVSQPARYSVGTQERFPQNIIACKWHLLNHDFEKKRGINNYEREKQEKYVFEDSG